MFSVEARPVPESALLSKYRPQSSEKAEPYTDCYSVKINGLVKLPDFVFAFYTTPVFKLERIILKAFAAKPSTDYQARQLADGSIDSFAAWNVERRTDDQLLMCDFRGHTRSWFMVVPKATDGDPETLLRFGSAVLPFKSRRTGKLEMGRGYKVLLGFHKLYSQVLLYSTKLRLEKPLAQGP